MTGLKRTPEEIEKSVSKRRGRKFGPQTPEQIAKAVATRIGSKRSGVTKEKMSIAQKKVWAEKTMTEAERKNRSEAQLRKIAARAA